ncbi:hypothetical protein KJR02_06925 [Methanimicrococcus blatticola]|nr:hypothetical protein [Methanimicrococcus blatticola]
MIFLFILTSGVAAADFEDGDGTVENPYQIKTADQLNDVRNNLTAHYVLIEDINLTGTAYENNWAPIGKYNFEFKGTFEGNNHKIENLKIQTTTNNGGFFGSAIDSYIANLTLVNVEINGKVNTSSLVGQINNSIVKNCHADGDVVGTSNVGGIVGRAKETKIESCSFKGSVTGTGTVGGIVGELYEADISGCTVKNALIKSSGSNTGGVIGRYSALNNKMTECVVEADVKVESTTATAAATCIGGLIGLIEGSNDILTPLEVQKSKSAAVVSAYGGDQYGGRDVGGLVGQSQYNISFESCTFSGKVTAYNEKNLTTFTLKNNASQNVGGFVGNVFSGSAAIKNSSVIGESIMGSF